MSDPRRDETEREILRLAGEIADGRPVSWDDRRSTDPRLEAAMSALRAVEAMASVLRREPDRATAPPRTWLEPGRILGRYRVEREAGRGGMGVVYLATDQTLERPVALKLLPHDVIHSPERLARLTREAKLLASLNHPNIATIHAMEDDGSGLRFLVLEWVVGETLAVRLRRGAIPWREALGICIQIADGLVAAHEGAVVHRDLKPGNVMITPRGLVKVLDFGLAWCGRGAAAGELSDKAHGLEPETGGVIAGTWGYVSPECLTGDEDHRADIFAFGCVLYECLAGFPAFPGATVDEVLAAVRDREPESARLPAEVPPSIRRLITSCVEKDPGQRLDSMLEVARVIETALGRHRLHAAPAAQAAHLPSPPTTFVGRSQDINRCREVLRQDRIVTLIGPGGGGKSRLALAVASASRGDYPGGVWLADLSAIEDEARVVEVLASALDVREDTRSSLTARVVAYLEVLKALIILDNCEHVSGAAAELVAALVAGTAHLRVLITSRESLRVPGEQVMVVGPLPVPPDRELDHPEAIVRYDAVRLFLDRALLVDPGFTPDATTVRAVGEICQKVEGLPLALELAAARVRVMSPGEIAVRLDRQLHLLRDTTSSATSRHRGMHATIAWSVDQLPPGERRALRVLAVFAGGCDIEAATAVCNAKDEFEMLDLLMLLADKSLVVVERRPSAASRYRLLEPVRQFAVESLVEQGEEEGARDLHLAYFLLLAEKAENGLYGPDQASWLRRLAADHDNLLAALDHSQRTPGGAEAALRIVGAVHRAWTTLGFLRGGEDACRRALARVDGSIPAGVHARALCALATIIEKRATTADRSEIRALFARALDLFRSIPARRGIAACLSAVGSQDAHLGDYASARLHFVEARELYREMGHRRGEATVTNNLGELSWRERDLAAALHLIEESQALHRASGDRSNEAISALNLAFLHLRLGDPSRSRQALVEALRFLVEVGSRTDVAAGALLGAAEYWLETGAFRRAARLYGAAEALLGAIPFAFTTEDPYWHTHDASIAHLRAALGAEALRAAWVSGGSADCQEILRTTLADLAADG